jgi:hypothetical protein
MQESEEHLNTKCSCPSALNKVWHLPCGFMHSVCLCMVVNVFNHTDNLQGKQCHVFLILD